MRSEADFQGGGTVKRSAGQCTADDEVEPIIFYEGTIGIGWDDKAGRDRKASLQRGWPRLAPLPPASSHAGRRRFEQGLGAFLDLSKVRNIFNYNPGRGGDCRVTPGLTYLPDLSGGSG